MAKQEIRTVNGKQYLYYTHYENGGRTVVYCGSADHTDAKLKGAKLELKQTCTTIKELQDKSKKLQSMISKMNTSVAKNSRKRKKA